MYTLIGLCVYVNEVMHIYVYVCKCNLMSLFNLADMYMILRLTAWSQITN